MYFIVFIWRKDKHFSLDFCFLSHQNNFFFKNICFFQKYFITFVNQYKQQLLWTH